MALSRVRFTVRRMMIAVAVVGLIFGCSSLWHRSGEFARKSEVWRAVEALYGRSFEVDEDFRSSTQERADRRELRPGEGAKLEESARAVVKDRVVRDYARSLKLKYRRAARYPFLPVAPDPPEPE